MSEKSLMSAAPKSLLRYRGKQARSGMRLIVRAKRIGSENTNFQRLSRKKHMRISLFFTFEVYISLIPPKSSVPESVNREKA